MRFAVLMLAVLIVAAPLQGQIVTDRPSFVESSLTVPERAVQVEAGFAFADFGLGSSSWSTPTLVRIGLSPTVEARVASGLVSHSSNPVADRTGVADVIVGAKVRLADAAGDAPSTALLFHVDLPVGSRAFRGEGFSPSVAGVAEWGLSETVTLGVMPGLGYNRTAGDDYLSALLGVVVGRAFTDRAGGYAEIAFAQLASDENGGNVGSFNLGATLLTETGTSQFDVQISLPVTSGSADFAFTVGYSVVWKR